MFPETNISPVQEGGKIVLFRGRDYNVDDGNAISFTNDEGTWPDLTGATVSMLVTGGCTGSLVATHVFSGQISVATGPGQTVFFELTASQLTIDVGAYSFEVVATQLDGDVHTLVRGTVDVLPGRSSA